MELILLVLAWMKQLSAESHHSTEPRMASDPNRSFILGTYTATVVAESNPLNGLIILA